ncbi:Hemolysin-type calcium-binding repeat-containing protein [Paracoccus thiocyanatus]|uniref:Hemolysin-type calcium-binding repeat-containing protein n=1 Tax=Paracoccus thiocyanatus TaxID=34006 RepID=A0A1N6P1P7_9RHOB|nr:calcium-binding protein [Paracoccus thiocyanatus]SIP98318.1 Hemolysin-type calcium-binding repeat-containing protein [Paracoccus thiocyanatus]
MARIDGTNNSETLVGTFLSDDIYGFGGNDILRGAFGADWLYGENGNDQLFGGFQDDRLYGGNGADTLNGDDGDDYFDGGAGADLMRGGSGNDIFDQTSLTEAPGDRIFGGAGIDLLRLDFGAVAGAVNFAIQDPTVTVTMRFGSAPAFTFREIEAFEIEGSDYADRLAGWLNDDTLSGGLGADTLLGGMGMDNLSGDDGNDLLRGGVDDDDLYGGAGNDTLLGEVGRDGIEGGSGNDTVNGGQGDDDLEGGTGRDLLIGGDGNDDLSSDTYYTDAGYERDVLHGNKGNDSLWIGINDHADGGLGLDRIHVDFRQATADQVWAFSPAAKQFANGTRVVNAEVLDYDGGSGRDLITGWNHADQINGNGGNDQLAGGRGNDTLDGGRGNDLLRGGDGNDLLYHESGQDTLRGEGGNDRLFIGFDENVNQPYRVVVDGGMGVDVVSFSSYELGAVVDLADQSRNTGLAHGKTLHNVEVLEGTVLDDLFLGGGGNDTFRGGVGSDVLNGRMGNDVLMGGDDSDVLTGGLGRDVFDFTDYSAYEWQGDVITDFQRGQDVMRLDRSDFGAGLRLVNAADPVVAGAAAALIFETDSKRLWYDADGAGGGDSPRLIATLNGVGQLDLSDFVFV